MICNLFYQTQPGFEPVASGLGDHWAAAFPYLRQYSSMSEMSSVGSVKKKYLDCIKGNFEDNEPCECQSCWSSWWNLITVGPGKGAFWGDFVMDKDKLSANLFCWKNWMQQRPEEWRDAHREPRSQPNHQDNALLIDGFWITGPWPLVKWTNAAKNTSWLKSGNKSVLKWGTGLIWASTARWITSTFWIWNIGLSLSCVCVSSQEV